MNIVANQRRAFISQARDDARRLQASLVNLSDAQRAAILALIAAKTSTPVDIVMITGEPGDWREAWGVCAEHLRATRHNQWDLGNGCRFIVEPAPGSETSYE